MITFVGGGGFGKITAANDVAIAFLTESSGNYFTHICNFRYTEQGTAHTLYFMRGASRALVASDLAAAGTALVSTAALTDGDANAPANLDYVAVKLDNGAWHLSTISAWNSTTKTLTLNTAIPTGRTAKKGAKIVLYGVAGDTYHAKSSLVTPTSATTNWPTVQFNGSLFRSAAPGEPILVYSANATAYGTFEYVNWAFAKI